MKPLGKLLAGLGVAAGALGGVELVLRTAWGFPEPSPHVIQTSASRLRVEGDGVALRHRIEPRQDVLIPPKGDRPRVVTLGGSSVRHSWVSDPEVNWPLWLDRALPDVEVVNLGSPGNTSLSLLSLVPSLEMLEPDLLIVYTGHNDFSEPVFQGVVAGSRLWMLPIHGVLSHSWIFKLLRGPTRSLAPPQPDQPRGILETDDPRALGWADETLHNFTAQVTEIVQRAPAPVVLATLMRNFDHPPAGLLALPEHPRCQGLARSLPTAPPEGPEALARRIDTACGPDRAVAHWYRAHGAAQAGQMDEATHHFAESLRRDPLPLRAPLDVDAALRSIAAQNGAPLVDLAADLGPLPDGRLFDDNLHPSPIGARQMAERFVPVVRAELARQPGP